MSLDELLGLALALYVLASLVLDGLRRGSPRRAPGEAPPHPPRDWERDWEEELRDLLEGREPREPQSGDESPESRDDRPWLEVEPIPLPTDALPGPAGHGGPADRGPLEPEDDEFWAEPVPPGWEEGEDDARRGEEGEPPVPEQDTVREPVPAPVPSFPPVPIAPPAPARAVTTPPLPATEVGGAPFPLSLPADAEQWRQAVILKEILDAPRAFRPYRPPWFGAARR